MSEATELRAAAENVRAYCDGILAEGHRLADATLSASLLADAYLASHPAATPTLDARAFVERVLIAGRSPGYTDRLLDSLTAELLPHLATGQTDGSELSDGEYGRVIALEAEGKEFGSAGKHTVVSYAALGRAVREVHKQVPQLGGTSDE